MIWTIGKHGSCIVSDVPHKYPPHDKHHEEMEYYGGHLVAAPEISQNKSLPEPLGRRECPTRRTEC